MRYQVEKLVCGAWTKCGQSTYKTKRRAIKEGIERAETIKGQYRIKGTTETLTKYKTRRKRKCR